MSRSVLRVLKGEATRGFEAVDCKRLEGPPNFFEKTGPTGRLEEAAGRLEEAADLFILEMIGRTFFDDSSESESESEEIWILSVCVVHRISSGETAELGIYAKKGVRNKDQSENLSPIT